MVLTGTARHALDSAVTRASEVLLATFETVCCSQGSKCDAARRACCSGSHGGRFSGEAQELSFSIEEKATSSRPRWQSAEPRPDSLDAASMGAHQPAAYGRPSSLDVPSPLDVQTWRAQNPADKGLTFETSTLEAVNEQVKGSYDLIRAIGGTRGGAVVLDHWAFSAHKLDSLDELKDQQVVRYTDDCSPEPWALQARRPSTQDVVAVLEPLSACSMAQAVVIASCSQAKAPETLRRAAHGYNACAENVCAATDQAILAHCVEAPPLVQQHVRLSPAAYPPVEPRAPSRQSRPLEAPASWRGSRTPAVSSLAHPTPPPAASNVQGLKEALQKMGIHSYYALAVHWCNEMGAATLREVAENVEELALGLALKPLELQRARQWAKEELARADHAPKLPAAASLVRRQAPEVERLVTSAPPQAAPVSLAASSHSASAKSAEASSSPTAKQPAAASENGESDPHVKGSVQGEHRYERHVTVPADYVASQHGSQPLVARWSYELGMVIDDVKAPLQGLGIAPGDHLVAIGKLPLQQKSEPECRAILHECLRAGVVVTVVTPFEAGRT